MTHHFKGGEGALWIQRNGPGTKPVFLGCHQLGDVDEPQGDTEPIYCPDPSGPNRFKVVGTIEGTADLVTTTITTDVIDELDELERANCPFTLFAHMNTRGRKDNFSAFDRTFVMSSVRVTSRGLSGLVARTPDDNSRSEQTFDVSAETLMRLKTPTVIRQTITETQVIRDLTFCNDVTCKTDDGPATAACQTGYAATEAENAATANVLVTTNGGTWAATAADPFAADEDISAIACFPFGRDGTRIIVARGTTDAANPTEIAYSDDAGATWVAVDVGSTNAEFVPLHGSLFALDRNNIWVGTDLGRIYYSEDAGLSWTVQDNQAIDTEPYNSIHFSSELVGWAAGGSNKIARTIDGGTNWSAVTGPTAENANDGMSIFAFDRNSAIIGYSSGTAYRTDDGGVTWSQLTYTGSGVGSVRDIVFFNDLLGYMALDNGTPVGTILWTIDGGYTWSALTTPTNAGLNSLYVCDQWTVFATGKVQGGTGFIAKGTV